MESIIFLTVMAAGAGVFMLVRFRGKQRVSGKPVALRQSSMTQGMEDDEVQFSIEESVAPSLTQDDEPISPLSQCPVPTEKKICEDNLLVLSVMAQPSSRFASYDLLQAISAAGLKFGEMNIFHYTWPDTNDGVRIFSVVSAEEPGEFNMDEIGDFSCPGLMLFMDPVRLPDPDAAFSIMLEKATQLAEDLDGVLCADPKTPWTPEVSFAYRNKLAQFWNHPVL